MTQLIIRAGDETVAKEIISTVQRDIITNFHGLSFERHDEGVEAKRGTHVSPDVLERAFGKVQGVKYEVVGEKGLNPVVTATHSSWVQKAEVKG